MLLQLKRIRFSDLLIEEDKKIINNNNTCLYNSQARFVDPDNYKGEKKLIFQMRIFVIMLIDLRISKIFLIGHATIIAKYNNTRFVFNNCYMIPDKNMDKDFRKGMEEIYFKPSYIMYVQEMLPEFIKKSLNFLNFLINQKDDNCKKKRLNEK